MASPKSVAKHRPEANRSAPIAVGSSFLSADFPEFGNDDVKIPLNGTECAVLGAFRHQWQGILRKGYLPKGLVRAKWVDENRLETITESWIRLCTADWSDQKKLAVLLGYFTDPPDAFLTSLLVECPWKPARIEPGTSSLLPRVLAARIADIFFDELYNRLCKLEFEVLEEKKQAVAQRFHQLGKQQFGHEGWKQYRLLRHEYYNKGYPQPVEFLVKNIEPSVTFFGVSVEGGVHRWMKEILEETERLLRIRSDHEKSVRDYLKTRYVGGFSPRLASKGYGPGKPGKAPISDHAFGCAIDIAGGENPFLTGAKAKAVDAILDFMQQT